MSSAIEEKVKQIIVAKLQVDINEVVPEASFIEDLGADSLDLTDLVMSLEEEFHVQISEADSMKLQKVKDVYNYIAEHCA